MLSYAFQVLKQNNYEDIEAEEFENIEDLFAAILAKGISQQLKQGLYREYITRKDTLPVMRGKLDIPSTIKDRMQHKLVLSCEFDELSENNLLNQILKTAVLSLLRDFHVSSEQRQALRKVLPFFDGIDTVDPRNIRWTMLHYQRSNRNYEMLINICYFVLNGFIQTTEQGKYRMHQFSDEHMARLYEKFILEYYKKHYSDDFYVSAAQVKWNLDEGNDESMIRFLPAMQTDITLKHKQTGKTLIIDAKYYSKTMQSQFDSHTLHSNNMYQIFTYVKNQDKSQTGDVSGLLLYARTGESITPDCSFSIGGNHISVKTLDLNCSFPVIEKQLEEVVGRMFGYE